MDEPEDQMIFKVVINEEEQYSIWPADRENPPGWNDGGKTGTKQECLDYIKEVWIDMRPLSLRKKMDQIESEGEEQVANYPEEDNKAEVPGQFGPRGYLL